MEQLFELLDQMLDSPAAQRVLGKYHLEKHQDQYLRKHNYLVDRKHGLDIKHDKKGRIQVIFLHSEGHENYAEFPEPLVENLTFHSQRADVRKALGEPSATSAPDMECEWDRYETSQGAMHFAYESDTNQIRLITLMAPDQIPR